MAKSKKDSKSVKSKGNSKNMEKSDLDLQLPLEPKVNKRKATVQDIKDTPQKVAKTSRRVVLKRSKAQASKEQEIDDNNNAVPTVTITNDRSIEKEIQELEELYDEQDAVDVTVSNDEMNALDEDTEDGEIMDSESSQDEEEET